MTLEEAWRVVWVRPLSRPIGELLDEGILNADRLQWAAEHAYNIRLKQAATIVLKSLERGRGDTARPAANAAQSEIPQFQSDMTVQQARAMPWPFRDFRGRSMGELLDAGLITARDLGGLVERAYEPRVKQAAIILMLKRIDQVVEESSAKGAVKLISGGRSYALRKQFEWFLEMGAICGAIIGAGSVLTIWYFVAVAQTRATASATETSPQGVLVPLLLSAVVGLIIILVIRWASERLLKRSFSRLEWLRRGQEGEDRVVETILPALDGDWTVFRNVVLPGRKGDLDVILAGPAGMWVLEVKTYQGAYRALGERWERYAGGRWQGLSKNPGSQARMNAGMLSSFLREKGVQLWIEPVVVWANPNSPLTLEEPKPEVWVMDNLRDEAGNLFSGHAKGPEIIQQAIASLVRVCEDAAKARAEESDR